MYNFNNFQSEIQPILSVTWIGWVNLKGILGKNPSVIGQKNSWKFCTNCTSVNQKMSVKILVLFFTNPLLIGPDFPTVWPKFEKKRIHIIHFTYANTYITIDCFNPTGNTLIVLLYIYKSYEWIKLENFQVYHCFNINWLIFCCSMYFGRLYQKLLGQKTTTTPKTSEEGRRNCESLHLVPPTQVWIRNWTWKSSPSLL